MIYRLIFVHIRSRWNKFFLIFLYIPFVITLLVGLEAHPLTVQTESFKIQLAGKKTWDLKFGLGDGTSLSRVGYPDDSFSLQQSLVVDLSGELGDYFSVAADLNDSEPGYLQEFRLSMDTDNWDGTLGNFSVGQKHNFTVYNKKLLGLRLSGQVEESQLETVLGRLQGISETEVFYGKTAEAEVTFSLYETDEGLVERGYKTNIKGLEHFGLDQQYVEGFTDPTLDFLLSQGLWDFLADWGFSYLKDTIEVENSKEVSSGRFKVVNVKKDFLILTASRLSLLRSRIKSYISDYNEDQTDEEQKEYPFNENTKYELNFLRQLQEYVRLVVGDEKLQLSNYELYRFYSLEETSIEEDSLSVEVYKNNQWTSVGSLPNYSYKLFTDQGIIDLDFPQDFFNELKKKKIEVSFQYEISGNMYMLGFSVAPNSERVYLNGDLLTKNTDYTIDYETGSLLVFREVGPDDKLKVDYERARGGIGGYAEYPRNLYGFTMKMKSDYGLGLTVSTFQAGDQAGEDISAEIPIMPNVHTVAGVDGKYQQNGWDINFQISGSINEFPVGDNQRKNLTNRINDVLSLSESGYDLTLFAHQDGFTVLKGEDWLSYGPQDGLAGTCVSDALLVDNLLVLAVSSGITTIELVGESPLDRAVNWESYYDLDNLDDLEVLDLATDGQTAWVATGSGVFGASLTNLDEDDPWGLITSSKFDDLSVTEIEYTGGYLWFGTSQGLYLFDLETEQLVQDDPLLSQEVVELKAQFDDVLVVTTAGISRINQNLEPVNLLTSSSVMSLAVSGEEVWYGTDSGFSKIGSSHRYGEKEITAILASEEGVWAGSKGYTSQDNYDILLYLLRDNLTEYSSTDTSIPGKDENRYRNIDPTFHTDRGVAANVDVTKTFTLWSREFFFSTGTEYRQPTYSEIGKFTEADNLIAGVSLGGELFKGFNLEASGDYSLTSFSTEENTLVTTTSLLAEWDWFVNSSAEVYWKEKQDETREIGLSFRGIKGLWEDRLNLEFGLSGVDEIDLKDESSDIYASLSSSANITLIESVTFNLSYSVPLAFEPFTKEEAETLVWDFALSRGFPLGSNYGLKVQLDDKGQVDDLLTSGEVDLTNQTELSLDFDKIDWGLATLSPSTLFSWKFSGSANKISGKISGNLGVDDLKARLSLSRKATLPINSQLVKIKDQLSGKVDYSLGQVTPTLSYGLGRTSLQHPTYGHQTQYTGNLAFSSGWRPFTNVRNKVTIGIDYESESDFSYRLFDQVDWEIITNLTPQFSFDLDYVPSTEEFDFTARAETSYPFSDMWGFSFTSGFNWGIKESGNIYTSFFGATGLKVTF